MRKYVLWPAILMSVITPEAGRAEASGDRSRNLSVEVTPLDGDILEEHVWDFSRQWIDGDRSRTHVCVYGDSLLAETVRGRRFWYRLSADSIFYEGEEDRLTEVKIDNGVAAGCVPVTPAMSLTSSFTAHGRGAGRAIKVVEQGVLDIAVSSHQGRLILAPGDTIPALVVRERRRFTASFPADSTVSPSHCTVESFRWYDTDGRQTLLPIAIQRALYLSSDGKPAADAAYRVAYIPDMAELAMDRQNVQGDDAVEPDTEAILAALRGADISCDGSTVSVSLTMPQSGLTVTADVMDAMGRLYIHGSMASTAGQCGLELDCRQLRSGEYIVAVAVDGVACQPEKRYIKIR